MTEGFINAPLAEVWQLFTTADGLRRAGVAHAEVDLKIGGMIRTHSDPKGQLGDDETTVYRVLAFDPQRMLTLRIEHAPVSLPGREAASDVWTVVYFSAAGEGMTQVRIVELGHTDEPASRALRQHLEATNRTLLAQLAKPYWPKCALCKAPATETPSP
jgi:uncharacterized protein YndB with AHSA1/START domain